mmetsp:Transcript_17566/g.26523  ORF Transcript_17566/g.26523 Transcript_17566/m.26523 type:complete len:255 (-) Transcript_17566:23-787(-)
MKVLFHVLLVFAVGGQIGADKSQDDLVGPFLEFLSFFSDHLNTTDYEFLFKEDHKDLLSPGRRKLMASCGIGTDETPCCITCEAMSLCSVLEGVDIEERYVPGDFQSKMSCSNFETRIARLDLWGAKKTEKPFREGAYCTEMVLDYTCRWWANMHGNRCDLASGPQVLTPCRSYCSTVATECAHTLDYLDLCSNIPCATADECHTGPDADLAASPCYIYELDSPLDDPAARPRAPLGPAGLAALLAAGVALAVW